MIKSLFRTGFYRTYSIQKKTRVYKPKKGLSFLCYHSVPLEREIDKENPNSGLAVDVKCFEQHLRYLSTECEVVNIDNAFRRQGLFERPRVVITFDDGFKDNYINALPLLEKYSIPAVIYITTDFIGKNPSLWWDNIWNVIESERHIEFNHAGRKWILSTKTKWSRALAFKRLHFLIMSLKSREQEALIQQITGDKNLPSHKDRFLNGEEINLLANHPLITIGSHMVSHRSLASLSSEEVWCEMSSSRKHLQNLAGVDINHCAYPFGGLNAAGPREYGLAKTSGFKTAVTTRCEPIFENQDPYSIPRHCVSYWHNINALSAKVNGWNAQWGRHV